MTLRNKRKSQLIMVGDFETTVYEGQEHTEVWASALVPLNTEDVVILGSIEDTFDYLKSLRRNVVIYYHNLKFDGAFWLDYLMRKLNFRVSCTGNVEDYSLRMNKRKDMKNGEYTYLVSDMGAWYNIVIKADGHIFELRDSLKLLPFSVKEIGKSFKTKHQKLDMEYTGYRYAGCTITEDERKYIANDVLVVKEALEVMFSQGHNKLTIGACCMDEYKGIIRCTFPQAYDEIFPDMYSYALDETSYGSPNADRYIRNSYKGGWCYLVKGKENKIYTKGVTADVNSLYPSMMHSESGNRFPIGEPVFWKGNYIPERAQDGKHYYFVRVRTRFKLKKGYLPFIQIKRNMLYTPNECLTTSDVKDRDGYYHENIIDFDGKVRKAYVELTLTMTDWILFNEHYDLIDCEVLDGCYFVSSIGIFDEYIDKYKHIKQTSTGAIRQIAKLFLNNLYGKLASSTSSDFKVAYLGDDNLIHFDFVKADDKKAGYIPIGSAITSYARNFTIRAAQKNYHGVNRRGFIYADTDSIHCDLEPSKLEGIKVHQTDFCAWKLESYWDTAIFVRQKTYIEHVTHEDGELIDKPYYNVKCAGMPKKCKDLFIRSMETDEITEEEIKEKKYNEKDLKFLSVKRTLHDFKTGLIVPGKLMPKRIKGGVVLQETDYEMRDMYE